MKRLLMALVLLAVLTATVPSLRERAAPRATQLMTWAAEGPLLPLVNRYRTIKTRSDMAKIGNALVGTRNRGMPPPRPAELGAFIIRSGINDTAADPWGSPYLLESTGDSIFLISSGPDLEPGTDDDLVVGIRYRDPRVRRPGEWRR